MFVKSNLATATLLLSAVTLSVPISEAGFSVEARDFSCIKGVRIITARGSNTPQTAFTQLEAMAQSVKAVVADTSFHKLVYPATLTDYTWSVDAGVANMTKRIVDHVNACPSQRLVLIGYSQGANVVANTLIGAPGTTGQGLAPRYRENIIAAVQFGDPTFYPFQQWDLGNATEHGVILRDNYMQYQTYGYAPSSIISYCDANDEYCASGNSLLVHWSYFNIYQTQATSWIISRIKATATNGEST